MNTEDKSRQIGILTKDVFTKTERRVLRATSPLVVEEFLKAPSLGCRGTVFYSSVSFLAHTSLPHD